MDQDCPKKGSKGPMMFPRRSKAYSSCLQHGLRKAHEGNIDKSSIQPSQTIHNRTHTHTPTIKRVSDIGVSPSIMCMIDQYSVRCLNRCPNILHLQFDHLVVCILLQLHCYFIFTLSYVYAEIIFSSTS
jgi:hypothetical protein